MLLLNKLMSEKGESLDLTKCKVNHRHKQFQNFLKRYVLQFLLYDPPIIATNLAK